MVAPVPDPTPCPWSEHLRATARAGATLAALIVGTGFVSAAGPVVNGRRLERAIFSVWTQCSGAVIQDRDGFLWVGTNANGLARFDGYEVRNMRTGGANALSDVYVNALYEDREGFLWIGTGGGVLNRYDKRTDTYVQYQHDPADPHSPSSAGSAFLEWQTITEDADGTLWFGTVQGLNAFDKKTGRFRRFLHDPADPTSLSHNHVSAVLWDQTSGTLWVGTNGGGLNRLDVRTGRCTRMRANLADRRALASDRVTNLLRARDGTVWVATYHGLHPLDEDGRFTRFVHDNRDPTSLPHDQVLSVTEDRQGTLWLGYVSTRQAGLARFDPRTGRFSQYRSQPDDETTPSSNEITRVFEDRSGILWVVNDAATFDKIDPNRQPFGLYRHRPGDDNSLLGPAVVAVLEDRARRLWVGTFPRGLSVLDKRTGRFDHHLRDRYYPGVLQDTSGLFWLGACNPGDLLLYDAERRRVVERYTHDPANPASVVYSLQINAIVQDRGDPDVLWLGTQAGLDRFDKRTKVFTHYTQLGSSGAGSSAATNMWMILQDRAGTLWLPTVGSGLFRLDPRTGRSSRYVHDPGDPRTLASNSVNVVFEDRDGVLWVGTASGFDRLRSGPRHVRCGRRPGGCWFERSMGASSSRTRASRRSPMPTARRSGSWSHAAT